VIERVHLAVVQVFVRGNTAAAAELDHLLAVSRQRQNSVRGLPFGGGLHAGLLGLFTILQYADDRDRDVVFVESHTGRSFFEQSSMVLECIRILTRSGAGLGHDESRALTAENQVPATRSFTCPEESADPRDPTARTRSGGGAPPPRPGVQ
jgi:hypothetical protein